MSSSPTPGPRPAFSGPRFRLGVRVARWEEFGAALLSALDVPFDSPTRGRERSHEEHSDEAGHERLLLSQGPAQVEHREDWDCKIPMETRDRSWTLTVRGLPHGASVLLGTDGAPPFGWFQLAAPPEHAPALAHAVQRAALRAASCVEVVPCGLALPPAWAARARGLLDGAPLPRPDLLELGVLAFADGEAPMALSWGAFAGEPLAQERSGCFLDVLGPIPPRGVVEVLTCTRDLGPHARVPFQARALAEALCGDDPGVDIPGEGAADCGPWRLRIRQRARPDRERPLRSELRLQRDDGAGLAAFAVVSDTQQRRIDFFKFAPIHRGLWVLVGPAEALREPGQRLRQALERDGWALDRSADLALSWRGR